MYKIKLIPNDIIVDLDEDKSVFEQLKEKDIHINSSCGGCASCTKCIIKVIDGEENMNEIPFEEKQILGNVFHMTSERLACQLKVNGSMTLDLTGHVGESKKEKKVLRRTLVEKNELREKKAQERMENPQPVKEGGFRRPKGFNYNEEDEAQRAANKAARAAEQEKDKKD